MICAIFSIWELAIVYWVLQGVPKKTLFNEIGTQAAP